MRFPSLKYNTHRRFCYVQFKSASEAIAATKADDRVVGDNLHLQVKISDPSRKQDRHGPVHEGREIHVSNIHYNASESDLKEAFSKYGTVELVRLPTKVNGEHRGFGFVVFSSSVRTYYTFTQCRHHRGMSCHRLTIISRRRQLRPWRCISKSSADGRCR